MALLGSTDEDALHEALRILTDLRAAATIRVARKRMRTLGIRSIPAGFAVHTDDVVGVSGVQPVQPLLQRPAWAASLPRSRSTPRRTSPMDRTLRKNLRWTGSLVPGQHVGVGGTLAEFGNDVGVEQVGHAS